MPWMTRKRKCKQSDGTSGSYVVLKKKSDGGTEQASCHTSEEKAKGSVGARYANEGKKMKLTGRQLTALIREAIDVVNVETGEIIDFGDNSLSGIPDKAVPDLMSRLGITPDVEENAYGDDSALTYSLSNDDWRKLEDETVGKQDKRTRKRKYAELTAEQERLNIDNLLQRLRDWAQTAADEWEADNPQGPYSIQDVAFDLADAAEHSFEQDEWDELLWHFDDNKEDLRAYTMDSM